MTLSRREFLGGMLAGLGAALASKLPKMAEPKASVAAENGDGLYEVSAEPIECVVGRGSPHIFDNFGIRTFEAGEDIIIGSVVSVDPATGYVVPARHGRAVVGIAYSTCQASEFVDIIG